MLHIFDGDEKIKVRLDIIEKNFGSISKIYFEEMVVT